MPWYFNHSILGLLDMILILGHQGHVVRVGLWPINISVHTYCKLYYFIWNYRQYHYIFYCSKDKLHQFSWIFSFFILVVVIINYDFFVGNSQYQFYYFLTWSLTPPYFMWICDEYSFILRITIIIDHVSLCRVIANTKFGSTFL